MNSRVASLLLAALLAALLVAPLAAIPPGGGPVLAAQRTVVSASAAVVPASLGARPLSPSYPLVLTASLLSSDQTGLLAFDRAVSQPGNPDYRQYLTEREFAARFAPPRANLSAVEAYFASFGAGRFTESPGGFGVTFAISASGADRALGTSLVQVGSRGADPLFSVASPPTLPAPLALRVAGLGGLSDVGSVLLRTPAVLASHGARAAASGPGAFVLDGATGENWYTGTDFAQAYDELRLFPGAVTSVPNATFPTGTAVATILMSGYNDSTQHDLPPWDPAQVFAYFNDTFPTGWPHPTVEGVPVTVVNTTAPPPGPYYGQNDTTFNEAENSLDVEMAGSAAPGATVVNFYFAASLFSGPSSTATIGDTADYFAQCLAAALEHNYSPERLVTVSNSFGLPDLNDSLWNQELAQAAATGVTVLAASGDQGDAPTNLSGRFQGQWPTWPASAAFDGYGTVSVGGATVNLSGQPTGTYNGGNLPDAFDPTVSGIASQSAWFDTLAGPGNYSGSEGGVSSVFPEPAWQFRSAAQPAIANASAVQGVTVLGRSEPDVALAANATIAYTANDSSGVYFDVLEGTSVASPLLAGILASLSAVAGHPFGYLDPELYRIGSYFAANPGPADPFLDVTQGGNYVFAAAPGWDATTGWGGLDAVRFLAADGNTTVAGYVYTGPTPGIPPPAPPPPTFPVPIATLAIAGIALAVGAVLVVFMLRPRRPAYGVPPAPPGTYGPPSWVTGAPPPPGTGPLPPPPPGYVPAGVPATFACPYCGTMRPAEPVRCPGCGAL